MTAIKFETAQIHILVLVSPNFQPWTLITLVHKKAHTTKIELLQEMI